MKGIILAGGNGTRLYPVTKAISKQLLPVSNKPMIYYPLDTLIKLGITEIFIISKNDSLVFYENLFGDGSHLGVIIKFVVQDTPSGIPDAFNLTQNLCSDSNVCLILGDNLFSGCIPKISQALKDQVEAKDSFSSRIFAYQSPKPENYGVIEFFEGTNEIKTLEEKPMVPKSNYVIPGLYVFDRNVASISKKLKVSKRGETEILDLIKSYNDRKRLKIYKLEHETKWFDMGTLDSIREAESYLGKLQSSESAIGFIEKSAYEMNFINRGQYKGLIKNMPSCEYKDFLDDFGD